MPDILATREFPDPPRLGVNLLYVDVPASSAPYAPDVTYTVKAGGETYVGCRLEKISDEVTRIWIAGGPN